MSSDIDFVPARTREPVVKHVYREVRRAILQGRLEPHARLVETALAEMLDVSRTPIREAISRLESEGLVTRLKGGGVVVGDVTAKLSESLVIRQCLEGASARLACQRATDEELRSIRAACDAAASVLGTTTLEQRSSVDRDFHMGIAKAANSTRLVTLIEEFYEYSFSEMMLDITPPEVARLQQQHAEIADALLARDDDTAEFSMRKHLTSVLAIIRSYRPSNSPAVADKPGTFNSS